MKTGLSLVMTLTAACLTRSALAQSSSAPPESNPPDAWVAIRSVRGDSLIVALSGRSGSARCAAPCTIPVRAGLHDVAFGSDVRAVEVPAGRNTLSVRPASAGQLAGGLVLGGLGIAGLTASSIVVARYRPCSDFCLGLDFTSTGIALGYAGSTVVAAIGALLLWRSRPAVSLNRERSSTAPARVTWMLAPTWTPGLVGASVIGSF